MYKRQALPKDTPEILYFAISFENYRDFEWASLHIFLIIQMRRYHASGEITDDIITQLLRCYESEIGHFRFKV